MFSNKNKIIGDGRVWFFCSLSPLCEVPKLFLWDHLLCRLAFCFCIINLRIWWHISKKTHILYIVLIGNLLNSYLIDETVCKEKMNYRACWWIISFTFEANVTKCVMCVHCIPLWSWVILTLLPIFVFPLVRYMYGIDSFLFKEAMDCLIIPWTEHQSIQVQKNAVI